MKKHRLPVLIFAVVLMLWSITEIVASNHAPTNISVNPAITATLVKHGFVRDSANDYNCYYQCQRYLHISPVVTAEIYKNDAVLICFNCEAGAAIASEAEGAKLLTVLLEELYPPKIAAWIIKNMNTAWLGDEYEVLEGYEIKVHVEKEAFCLLITPL